jgi:hypothetical protein
MILFYLLICMYIHVQLLVCVTTHYWLTDLACTAEAEAEALTNGVLSVVKPNLGSWAVMKCFHIIKYL